MRLALLVALGLALLALVVAVVAPFVAERAVNGVLATMPGYDARVDDVDLTTRGLALDDLRIVRPDLEPPFVTVERIEVRPRLRRWLRGDLVVDVAVDGAVVSWILGVDEARSQTSIDPEWVRRQVERVPVAPDGLTVRAAALHYRDHAASPDVHVVVDALEVDGTGLSDPPREDAPLPGRIEVRGRVEQTGRLSATALLDATADEPRFVLDARVSDVPLAAVGDALRAYAGFDAAGGTFSVASRVEAAEGRYRVVARPEVEDLDVVGVGEGRREGRSLPARAWEAIVGAAGQVGEAVTPGEDRIETTVRFSGEFGDQPALIEVLEALPTAWLGSLVRALRVGGASAEENAEAAAAPSRERGERRPR